MFQIYFPATFEQALNLYILNKGCLRAFHGGNVVFFPPYENDIVMKYIKISCEHVGCEHKKQ